MPCITVSARTAAWLKARALEIGIRTPELLSLLADKEEGRRSEIDPMDLDEMVAVSSNGHRWAVSLYGFTVSTHSDLDAAEEQAEGISNAIRLWFYKKAIRDLSQ